MHRHVVSLFLAASAGSALSSCSRPPSAPGRSQASNAHPRKAHPAPAPRPTPTPLSLGLRPSMLIDQMKASVLQSTLKSCEAGPFHKSSLAIGHRGAPLHYPEHTKESYEAAAKMGAGRIECDVTFTKDEELVCRHSQCDLHSTTNILETPLAARCSEPFDPASPENEGKLASARCCTSDLTLKEFKSLCGRMDAVDERATTVAEYLKLPEGTESHLQSPCGTLLSHKESISLLDELGVDFIPELKEPLVEMPFGGTFERSHYATKMLDEYVEASIDPKRVWPQSFHIEDHLLWEKERPEFFPQAIYLTDGAHSLRQAKSAGVRFLAPPLWTVVERTGSELTATSFARRVHDAGLSLVVWGFERPSLLTRGPQAHRMRKLVGEPGDVFEVLDALAKKGRVSGVFTDWPATVTYYDSCREH